MKAVEQLVKDYKSWVGLPLDEAWVEELEQLIGIREELHRALKKRGVRHNFELEVRKIDRYWQKKILKQLGKRNSWVAQQPRPKEPKIFWWNWIYRLDELGSEDLNKL